MKTYKHLYDQICSFENLLLAAQKTQKGKRFKPGTAAFNFHLERELLTLQRELQEQTAARRSCPRAVWATVRRKLDQINRVRDLRDLTVPPGNRLERLRGNRSGQHGIRVNEQYRVCFRWEVGDAYEVEITDYH